MSNILKLIKFDFYILKPYLKRYLIFLIIPFIFSLNENGFNLLQSFIFTSIYSSIIVYNLFEITEKNNMDRIYGILPVSKSEMVIGRYVFALLVNIVYVAIFFIEYLIIFNLVLGKNISGGIVISSLVLSIIYFITSIALPLPYFYKLGPSKGKIPALTITLIISFSFIGILGYSNNTGNLIKIILNYPILLLLIPIAFAIIAYTISIIISIKVFKNKEIWIIKIYSIRSGFFIKRYFLEEIILWKKSISKLILILFIIILLIFYISNIISIENKNSYLLNNDKKIKLEAKLYWYIKGYRNFIKYWKYWRWSFRTGELWLYVRLF